MQIHISQNAADLGREAALAGAKAIQKAIQEKGSAAVILATGKSQFTMLEALTSFQNIDWSKVTCFHLDEYVGLPDTHNASFRKYLKEKYVEKVSPVKDFFYVNGDSEDPRQECQRLGACIADYDIDVAFIGIGENAHIAFNDPPADFKTRQAYIVVSLDTACRQQQLNEGWFDSFDEVPSQAISMSVHQIMLSKTIICSVPDKRKALAVKHTIESEVTNRYPGSILQRHPDCTIFLDTDSASLLEQA